MLFRSAFTTMPSTFDPAVIRIIHAAEASPQSEESKIQSATRTTSCHVRSTHNGGTDYFAKVGGLHEVEQITGEAESLLALNAAAPGLAPHLLDYCIKGQPDRRGETHPEDLIGLHGGVAGCPVFVSEYKSMGSLTESAAKKLAKRLATEVHRYESPHEIDGKKAFGFAEIGRAHV